MSPASVQEVERSRVATRPFVSDTAVILRGAGWFGVATLIGMGLEYGTQAFLAAKLGPADFGVLNVGFQIFSFCLVLATLALPSALAHFIPRFASEKGGGAHGGLVTFGLTAAFVCALLCGAVLLLLAPVIADRVFHEPSVSVVIRLFAVALPLWALVLVMAGAFRGLRMSQQASLLTATYERALRLGFSVAFVAAGLGLVGATVAYLCSSGLALLWGARWLRASPGRPRLTLPDSRLVKRVGVYAGPLLLAQLLEQARRGAQPLLVAYFVDVRAAGIYAVGLLLATGMTTVLVALNFIYLPLVSSLSFERDRERIRRLYDVVTTYGLLIVVPLCLVVLLVPGAFLAVFGTDYEEGAQALRLLALAALVNVAAGTVGSTLLAAGRTGVYLRINLAGIVLSIGMSVALVPSFGIVGAAAADLIVSVLWNAWMLTVAKRMYGFQPFGRRTVAVVALSIACLALVAPAILSLAAWTPWAVIVFTPLYVAVVISITARFGLAGPDVTETLLQAGNVMRARLMRRLSWRRAHG